MRLLVISILFFVSVLAVGWDTYRNYDLYTLRPGEETHEFSSYDRKNHNDDGFEGTYSCLRQQIGQCVIAEYSGPGEIASVWFTYEPDSIRKAGIITITLDGKNVLKGSIQDIVDGVKGTPFIWPLVGNTNDTMGGNVIKVPMPFAKSMLVTTSNNPHFYHVVYKRLARAETFNPFDKAEDVVSHHKTFGIRDPKPGKANEKYISQTLDAKNATLKLATNTCGIISKLGIRIDSIQASAYVQDDGRAFAIGGGSSFTMRLDPRNKKCRLTRRVDQSIGYQNTDVYIEGKKVGSLNSGESSSGTWLDEVLELPEALTRKRHQLGFSINCVSSSLDCNEFLYALHCQSEDGKWESSGYLPSAKWTLMDVVNVGWNNPHDEAAHAYTITNQTWQGLRQFEYRDNQHSHNPLPDIRISLEFDGNETVSSVPIGPFFGSGLTKGYTRNLMASVDSLIANGAWISYFPMPFSKSATISLVNSDGSPVKATVEAVIQPCDERNTPTTHPWGYFRTQYRRGNTTPGQLWPILSAHGPGVAYGVTHTIRGNTTSPSNTLEFLEGDEQVWLNRTTPGNIDDSTATMLGTGTEDFYESGWYFQDFNAPGAPVVVPYAMPLTGLVSSAYSVLGVRGSSLSVYRLMIADSMSFGEAGISFNIEHGPDGNNVAADYETCAYYYG